jgi:uncharacterized protein YjbI with pentapeptide repeats
VSQLKIRRTAADLPVFDDEAVLESVSSLAPDGGSLSNFEFSMTSLRALDPKDISLRNGKIRTLRTERAAMTSVRARSVEFTACDLASFRWSGGKLSRTRFDGCKLLGARFENLTVEHVVFTSCKLDYAVLDQVRATGPVLFVNCSLREAEFTACNLQASLFDDCDLHLTNFGPGSYRACDLRGNDLSAITGAYHLKRVVIDHIQLVQLAEALATELEVTFTNDPPDPPETPEKHSAS